MSAGAVGPPALAGSDVAPAGRQSGAAGAAGEPSITHRWVFALTVAFLWAAAVLRSALAFDGRQRLLVVALLAAWLATILLGELASRRRSGWFSASLVVQAGLVFILLTQSDASDYFATLLAAPTMQATARWRPRSVALLIAVFAALTWLGLAAELGPAGALPLVALYAAAQVFFAAYAGAASRSAAARRRSEAVAADLGEANLRLAESAERSERIGAARERQQLARDLHDSLTQTLFSMNLTAQSAQLLLCREPREVGTQLDQIEDLTRAALEELRRLRGEGASMPAAGGGLAAALRRHCEERRQRDGLDVTLEVDGDEVLPADEEQALLRIAQEGLNNVIKHAGCGTAVVRLRLRRPLRLEVEDHGGGFDPQAAGSGGGMGLAVMRERAAERGWRLAVLSAPGSGTRVLVEQSDAGGDAAASEGGRGRDRA